MVVPVEVTCEPGASGQVNVQVSQARGRHVADGFGFANIACEGPSQIIDVVVHAHGGAFKQGVALVEANVYVCPDYYSPCESDMDVEEISVVR